MALDFSRPKGSDISFERFRCFNGKVVMFVMKDRDLLSALNNPIQQSLMFGSRCLPLMDSCPAARQVFGVLNYKRNALGGYPLPV